MYLAPLNFDRFFKKVFSDLHIAKSFLEDFFEKEIETIELLERKHKITDEASAIEFDFRCKINGQYHIVDMQQWYKADVVKRFYAYHALGSALQLETLPKIDLPKIEGKKFDLKVYQHLLPTITLIWMAHDNLGFEEDYVAFTLLPEQTADFLKNEALWQSEDLKEIGEERQKALTLLQNETKSLDFLAQNRLVYAFQKNIVKNKKLKKYFDWFDLAEKSSNPNNVEADFEAYKKNPTLMAVMERIEKKKFQEEELSALEALEHELTLSAIWRVGETMKLKEEAIIEARLKVREELTPKITEELTSKITEELTPKIIEKVRAESKMEVVIAAYQQGISADLIANFTHLSIEKVNEIIESAENKSNDK